MNDLLMGLIIALLTALVTALITAGAYNTRIMNDCDDFGKVSFITTGNQRVIYECKKVK